MDIMTGLSEILDGSYASACTGLSYQKRLSGDKEAILLYDLCTCCVPKPCGSLRKRGEPFVVMLSMPVGILGALITTWHCDQSNNVHFKVGLLTTIGLAARNAILTIESAEPLRKQ